MSLATTRSRLRAHLALGLFILLSLFLIVSASNKVVADQIQNRSVSLSTYTVSATATHSFTFFSPSTNVLGSISFEYCDNSPLFNAVCSPPAGLDVSGASLSGQSGNNSFSVDSADTTQNKLVIARPPLAGSIVMASYSFSNIVNPSSAGSTVFVRIST